VKRNVRESKRWISTHLLKEKPTQGSIQPNVRIACYQLLLMDVQSKKEGKDRAPRTPA